MTRHRHRLIRRHAAELRLGLDYASEGLRTVVNRWDAPLLQEHYVARTAPRTSGSIPHQENGGLGLGSYVL